MGRELLDLEWHELKLVSLTKIGLAVFFQGILLAEFIFGAIFESLDMFLAEELYMNPPGI
jgi:hypothetical protein